METDIILVDGGIHRRLTLMVIKGALRFQSLKDTIGAQSLQRMLCLGLVRRRRHYPGFFRETFNYWYPLPNQHSVKVTRNVRVRFVYEITRLGYQAWQILEHHKREYTGVAGCLICHYRKPECLLKKRKWMGTQCWRFLKYARVPVKKNLFWIDYFEVYNWGRGRKKDGEAKTSV